MVTMTLAVPEKLKERMDKHPELNWSEVARQAFISKLQDMEFLEQFSKKSSMTEKDAILFGKRLKKQLAKRYKQ